MIRDENGDMAAAAFSGEALPAVIPPATSEKVTPIGGHQGKITCTWLD